MKIALITGGSSGIGAALAIVLANQAWKVYVVGRNETKLQSICSDYPENIVPIQADLSDLNSIVKICNEIKEPHIDVLVNNAAIIDPMVPITQLNLTEFEKAQRVNVTSCLGLTQSLLSKLEGGRVLFTSSGAAVMPLFEWATYCVSKAALRMLKMSFQAEIKEVAFSDVKPGIVETNMLAHVMDSGANGSAEMKQMKSNGNLIKPYVVANFLNWILTSIDRKRFESTEWDIYDTTHHSEWLKEGVVPSLEN